MTTTPPEHLQYIRSSCAAGAVLRHERRGHEIDRNQSHKDAPVPQITRFDSWNRVQNIHTAIILSRMASPQQHGCFYPQSPSVKHQISTFGLGQTSVFVLATDRLGCSRWPGCSVRLYVCSPVNLWAGRMPGVVGAWAAHFRALLNSCSLLSLFLCISVSFLSGIHHFPFYHRASLCLSGLNFIMLRIYPCHLTLLLCSQPQCISLFYLSTLSLYPGVSAFPSLSALICSSQLAPVRLVTLPELLTHTHSRTHSHVHTVTLLPGWD